MLSDILSDMKENIQEALEGESEEFMAAIRHGAFAKHVEEWWHFAVYAYPIRCKRFWDLLWMPLMGMVGLQHALAEGGKVE